MDFLHATYACSDASKWQGNSRILNCEVLMGIVRRMATDQGLKMLKNVTEDWHRACARCSTSHVPQVQNLNISLLEIKKIGNYIYSYLLMRA